MSPFNLSEKAKKSVYDQVDVEVVDDDRLSLAVDIQGLLANK